MTLQVIYSLVSRAVMQWQDTDVFNYAEPPAGVEILTVTDLQFSEQEKYKSVVSGELSEEEPDNMIPLPIEDSP